MAFCFADEAVKVDAEIWHLWLTGHSVDEAAAALTPFHSRSTPLEQALLQVQVAASYALFADLEHLMHDYNGSCLATSGLTPAQHAELLEDYHSLGDGRLLRHLLGSKSLMSAGLPTAASGSSTSTNAAAAASAAASAASMAKARKDLEDFVHSQRDGDMRLEESIRIYNCLHSAHAAVHAAGGGRLDWLIQRGWKSSRLTWTYTCTLFLLHHRVSLDSAHLRHTPAHVLLDIASVLACCWCPAALHGLAAVDAPGRVLGAGIHAQAQAAAIATAAAVTDAQDGWRDSAYSDAELLDAGRGVSVAAAAALATVPLGGPAAAFATGMSGTGPVLAQSASLPNSPVGGAAAVATRGGARSMPMPVPQQLKPSAVLTSSGSSSTTAATTVASAIAAAPAVGLVRLQHAVSAPEAAVPSPSSYATYSLGRSGGGGSGFSSSFKSGLTQQHVQPGGKVTTPSSTQPTQQQQLLLQLQQQQQAMGSPQPHKSLWRAQSMQVMSGHGLTQMTHLQQQQQPGQLCGQDGGGAVAAAAASSGGSGGRGAGSAGSSGSSAVTGSAVCVALDATFLRGLQELLAYKSKKKGEHAAAVQAALTAALHSHSSSSGGGGSGGSGGSGGTPSRGAGSRSGGPAAAAAALARLTPVIPAVLQGLRDAAATLAMPVAFSTLLEGLCERVTLPLRTAITTASSSTTSNAEGAEGAVRLTRHDALLLIRVIAAVPPPLPPSSAAAEAAAATATTATGANAEAEAAAVAAATAAAVAAVMSGDGAAATAAGGTAAGGAAGGAWRLHWYRFVAPLELVVDRLWDECA